MLLPDSNLDYVNGLFVKRRENAPDFVITNLSFSVVKFIEYLNSHANAKGYVNIDVLRSKKGILYAKLNDWTPETSEGLKMTDQTEKLESMVNNVPDVEQEEINVEKIPF